MNDLTEQWKKGELPEGHYYVKDGGNMIAEYLDGYFYNDGVPMTSFSGGVDEVLAEVPSYDQWQKHRHTLLKTQEKNCDLEIINKQLKGLLKKHRDIFARTLALCVDLNFSEKQKKQFADDIAEIDQVLGEE